MREAWKCLVEKIERIRKSNLTFPFPWFPPLVPGTFQHPTLQPTVRCPVLGILVPGAYFEVHIAMRFN